MKLYTLLGGKSKKKMVRLETNSKQKCENYKKALEKTSVSKYKWFEIREAFPDEELKVHKSQNVLGQDIMLKVQKSLKVRRELISKTL